MLPYTLSYLVAITTQQNRYYAAGVVMQDPVLRGALHTVQRHLEILGNILTRGSCFHLILGPANSLAGPDYTPTLQVRKTSL